MSHNDPDRTIDAFFYGLYMDEGVLASKGVKARFPRKARVSGFSLRLGQKATLLRKEGAVAYGMLFALTHAEIDTLYSGLEAYRPEPVLAQVLDGEAVPALCMNLLDPPAPDERNPEYAAKLRLVLEKLGFPRQYVEGVT